MATLALTSIRLDHLIKIKNVVVIRHFTFLTEILELFVGRLRVLSQLELYIPRMIYEKGSALILLVDLSM